MGKVIKILIGCGLIGLSLFYLLGIGLTIGDVKETAAYSADAYLQMEYKGCENIGDVLEIPQRGYVEAPDGYDFYRLEFTASNLSSVAYYGNPVDALSWSSEVFDSYTYYHGPSYYEELFYSYQQPGMPGKTSVTVEIHFLIQDGIDSVTVCYAPNWEEDEIEMEVSLRQAL